MKKERHCNARLEAKWETHAHTGWVSPCASVKPKELVDRYIQAGYDGLTVTDHYSEFSLDGIMRKPWQKQADFLLGGYRACAEYGLQRGLRVALGFEITFLRDSNDFLVFGMTEKDIFHYPELYKMDRKTFRELADACGWLVYQAHPYRYGLSPVDPKWIDGVEACNTHPTHQSYNSRAQAFAAAHMLWTSSGSDTHSASQAPAGGILLERGVHDAKSMAACIRAHQGRIPMLGGQGLEYKIGG